MAQLKSTNITGNLAVTGNILASKIIKLGGTSDQILLANGDVATLSNLGAGNVTGSSLTNNTIILGGGDSSVKTSSKTIATSVGADDTTVPTSKAVKDYVTGLGYITGSYLPLAGGTMTGSIEYAGATREIISFAPSDTTWRGGLKYSWSSNTTIGLWGKHTNSQFVWHAGTDFSTVDVNGTSTRTYDFQVGRDVGTGGSGNLEALLGGKPLATQEWVENLGYVTGSYLPLAGGQMSGPITYPVTNGNNKSSNYISAGGGYATGSGKEGLKILALEQSDATMGLGVDLTGGPYELTVATSRSTNSQASKIVFATHTVKTTAYKTLATLSASGAESPTVTFNVAGTIQENGTSLSAKYLGISAKAADADKLDGQDGTYYLNYNNFTNKPTIPNPANYYWANVKVSASSSTSTTPTVKSLGVSDGSSATAAAKATWQYNSTTDCIELVWA